MNQHLERALDPSKSTPVPQHRRRIGRAVAVAVVLAAAAVAATLVIQRLQRLDLEANAAVDDIEGRLADLDPVTRAAVIAKLSSDGVDTLKAMRKEHS